MRATPVSWARSVWTSLRWRAAAAAQCNRFVECSRVVSLAKLAEPMMLCVEVSSAACSEIFEQRLRLNECFKEQRLILHNLAACKILGKI